jgi:hypothetical protein
MESIIREPNQPQEESISQETIPFDKVSFNIFSL